ncbi:MAG: hypothetical protein N4A76_15330 [Firmicutes bacterium]|jgi:hypothetical protein|nr:hypothetical protein [Bacillota bacterium]
MEITIEGVWGLFLLLAFFVVMMRIWRAVMVFIAKIVGIDKFSKLVEGKLTK